LHDDVHTLIMTRPAFLQSEPILGSFCFGIHPHFRLILYCTRLGVDKSFEKIIIIFAIK